MPAVQKTVAEIRSRAEGYEKTEDISEKTSLADQDEVRTVFINQPQLTKFCNNHVSGQCQMPRDGEHTLVQLTMTSLLQEVNRRNSPIHFPYSLRPSGVPASMEAQLVGSLVGSC